MIETKAVDGESELKAQEMCNTLHQHYPKINM